MSIILAYNEQDGIIQAVAHGSFDWPVMAELVAGIAGIYQETCCNKVLLDCRDLKVNLSTLQIYLTPEKLAGEFNKYGLDAHNFWRALVLANPDQDFRFLETVSQNKFQKLQLFLDENQAREWLKAK